MKANDVSQFYFLLNGAGVDLNELSVVQLDRYIQAFNDGARTVRALIDAVEKPRFPREVVIYAHINGDDLHEIGEQAGLSPDANRTLSTINQIPLTICLHRDGTAYIKKIGKLEIAATWLN